MSVTWEDPPPGGPGPGRPGRWTEELQVFLEHPGQWGCLGVLNRGMSRHLKTVAEKLGGKWRVVTRTKNAAGEAAPDKQAFIYVLYEGPSNEV